MQITVYSTPGCPQCSATCRKLDKAGAEYDVVDMSDDDRAREYVVSLGHQQAPVVVVSDGAAEPQHWSGYRPDKLADLLAVA